MVQDETLTEESWDVVQQINVILNRNKQVQVTDGWIYSQEDEVTAATLQ